MPTQCVFVPLIQTHFSQTIIKFDLSSHCCIEYCHDPYTLTPFTFIATDIKNLFTMFDGVCTRQRCRDNMYDALSM